MKLPNTQKVIAVIATAATLLFSSCVDDSINLDKLSTDLKLGGNLAAPLGEMTVSIQDIMDDMVMDSSNLVLNERNGVVNLYFSDTLDYNNPANIDFSTFGAIEETLNAGGPDGFATSYGAFPITIPNGLDVTFPPVVRGYNFNEVNDTLSKQRVDSIRFSNTTISVVVTSSINLPAGLASLDIQLPGEFLEIDRDSIIKVDLAGTSTTKQFTYENFVVNAEGADTTNFDITVKVHGDGATQINASDWIKFNISLNNTSFVAYGYFNYGTDILQKDQDIDIDLYSVLPPGSMIYPNNPEFDFELISNVGVPLLFNMKDLKTFDLDTIPILTKSATFNGLPTKTFDINAATSYGSTATSNIKFDKEIANGKTNELFRIKMDSASAKFSFGIKDMPINTSGQFVSSDSKMRLKLGVNMPFWLDEGSILSVSDTIDVNTSLADLFSDDKIEEAYLRVKYTNMLPMGVTAYIRLLDKDTIPVSSTLYQYEIKAGVVDATGATISPTEKIFDIKFDKTTIDELKNTEFIKLTVTAAGYDINSKMKFRMQDWLKIKLGAYAIGNMTNK